jgi:predicted dehydrogenase
MSSHAPVRIGVLGLGYWGPHLVRNLHDIDAADVVTVCDLRAAAVDAVRRRYPTVRPTTRVEDVLEDDRIDAVCISTPVGTHYELASAAIEAGKHVFVEKPLAGSTAEATALASAARDAGVVLMPGHTFLYSPPVNVIRKLLAGGELGDLYFVSSSRVNLGIHQSDVSVIWDLGPHDFSILRYWLDESPTRVGAISRSCIIPGIADVAFVTLEFPSGAVAHVEMSWLAPSKLRRTTLVGSNKMVVYDDASTEPVRIFDSGVIPRDPETFGEYRLTYRTGDIVSPQVDPVEPLSLELADFCFAIQTGRTPRSTVELGIDVVRTIEAAERSASARGEMVAVEPSARSVA